MKHLLAIIITLSTSIVNADVLPEQKLEIEHLLSFVKNSTCKIIRNGDLHKGSEAVTHIKRKYDHFKNDINTAEQFIEYAATKSTFSGRHYKVKCDEKKPFKTEKWLLEELQNFRNNKST